MDINKKYNLGVLSFLALMVIAIAGCKTQPITQPTPFEPKEQRVIVVGCEELKQRDPEADC